MEGSRSPMNIGIIELAWEGSDLTEIDITTAPAFGDYDAIIIDLDGLFQKLATLTVGGAVQQAADGTTVAARQPAMRLASLLANIRSQLRELCEHGGIVVGLSKKMAGMGYDSTGISDWVSYRGMLGSSLAYVTSTDILFGPVYTRAIGIPQYTMTAAHGKSLVFIQHSIWDAYLRQELEFFATIGQLPPGFQALAVQTVRGTPTDKIVAAVEYIGQGQMALLPWPVPDDAIESLVDCIKNVFVGPNVPEWVHNVNVPGISAYQGEISRLENDIKTVHTEIEQLKQWGQLLYEKNDALDTIVGRALKFIGFTCDKPDTTDDADWIITDLGQRISVEVGGSKDPIGKGKITQLAGWVDRGYNRGLLVVNPCCLTDPHERERWPLDRQISKEGLRIAADRGDLAVMLTTELFHLVELCLQERQSDAQDEFRRILGKSLRIGSDNHWERM